MDFTKVSSWSTEIYYEEYYDEEINKLVNGRVCYNGGNYTFNEAIAPLIKNAENPREAWIECATMLFKFLKHRSLEAIDNENYLLAIGYIESLDSQANDIDTVLGANKMRQDVTLVDLKEQLEDLEDFCYSIYYEEYEDEDENEYEDEDGEC